MQAAERVPRPFFSTDMFGGNAGREKKSSVDHYVFFAAAIGENSKCLA